MKIKEILDEISNESSTNQKMVILGKYKDNETLKRVLYNTLSGRVKYYLKQIPDYKPDMGLPKTLEWGLEGLNKLSSREYTGHEASEWLTTLLSSLSYDDSEILVRVVLKDLKIGMGRSNVNKVFKDLIEKTGYMGCKPFSIELVNKLLKTGTCLSQEKMDGRFVSIIIRNGEVEAESRQGEPTILDNPKFIEELTKLPDCVLNGELTMGGGIDRYQSNGIISSLISISNKKSLGVNVSKEILKFESKHMGYREALALIKFTAWDILNINEYFDRNSKIPYNKRLDRLIMVLEGYENLSVVETKYVDTIDDVMDHFNEIAKNNGEGTVLKAMDGPWVDSKPNHQIKIKKEINLDLKITGFNLGTGKNSELISSLNVESSDGLLKTRPTGITEDEMVYITKNQDFILGKILEVKCSGLSQDSTGAYSLLHPVYIKIRDDKDIANSLEECIEIDKSSSLL